MTDRTGRTMTDTEFGVTCQQLGRDKGRLEVALELSEWVLHHPNLLISPAAGELAKDLITKCQEIIQAVGKTPIRNEGEG